VNYYKRHIGDYAAATRHLSLLEHGVYTLLLDVYYTSEKQLPAELRAVQRLVGARSEEEREAVETVLNEFFELTTDGWSQSRCDEEIHNKQVKSEANQVIGRMGGRPKVITDSVIPESETLKPESETDSEGFPAQKPNGTQANSHKPIASNTDTALGKPTAIPDCPHLILIDLFGKHLPELPQPKPELWAGKNAEALRARWKWVLTARRRNGDRYAATEAEALDWFGRFFGYVAGSDFLSGRSGKWTNCDLGWLVKADNFAKVVQGNYENKAAA
jgi:uncharacterized protein YdaU (DUF1376 family)